jgi:hypothetical protein
MDPLSEIILSDHALERIKERSLLDPETVVELIRNGAVYEAHRENGVSYFVLWSTRDRRPFLAVTENMRVISFYYTYEYHRRKDRCVILPVHIKLAKKALHDFYRSRNTPRYHVSVSWEEISESGRTHPHARKICTCSKSEFESFKGTLLEFVGQKAEVVKILSEMQIQKGCRATLVVKKSDGYTLASAELSA